MFQDHIFRLHGLPDKVISDRGPQFVSRFWQAFLKLLGIEQGLSSAYHPQTDGQTERVNQVLEQYLRCFGSYQQDDWASLISLAEFAYNNADHSSTEMAPFEVVYGTNLRHFPELAEPPAREPEGLHEWRERTRDCWGLLQKQLQEVKETQKRDADRKRRPGEDIQPGDRVYLSTRNLRLNLPSKKLGPRFLGPFEVLELIHGVSARLLLPKNLRHVHPVFHVSLLKKSPTDDTWHPETAPPAPEILPGGEHHEVKEILDSRFRRRKLQYLVEWKNFAMGDREWVWAKDVLAPQLIERFHRKWPNRPGGPGLQNTDSGGVGGQALGGQNVGARSVHSLNRPTTSQSDQNDLTVTPVTRPGQSNGPGNGPSARTLSLMGPIVLAPADTQASPGFQKHPLFPNQATTDSLPAREGARLPGGFCKRI